MQPRHRRLQPSDTARSTICLAYNKRGDCHTRQGSNLRALEDYAKAIELDPTNSRAYKNRGEIYENLGQLDRALEAYDEAVRIDPKFSGTYFNRGDIFRKKGDFDRAISEYTVDPTRTKYADAFNRRGIAHLRKGEYERAITDQTEAIRFNPKHAKAFNDRCWAATIVGWALQQALADCNESLRLNGNDPDALASRGFPISSLVSSPMRSSTTTRRSRSPRKMRVPSMAAV